MNLKEEKGSMAVYVTIVLMSMVFILTAVFLISNSARKNQLKTAIKVKETYEADNGRADKIYDELTNKPFEPKQTPEPPTGGTEMEDMTNGIIEVKWLEGTSYNVSDTQNAPSIKTDLPEGTTMEQVIFDESSKTWVQGTEYSYVAGAGSKDNNSSKWANARVTINGVESYFVWIPRYAYRIIYFDSADSKKEYQEGKISEEDAVTNGQIIGYSDSRGIVDAQGRKIESVVSTTKTMVSEDYFMVHPAFINDVDAGGWTEELEGIWIGKYETARSDAQGTTQGSATTLKVQPGVTSFRNQTIGTFYTYSLQYSKEFESHMLKNSEWGAVAYLTESTYGRNGTEVTINNNETTYYTGGGSGTAYIDNLNQSSTGNIYGIYDLSGNALEYVAAYHKDGDSTYLNNGSTFTNKKVSDKYSTVYKGTNKENSYKYGDATYETSKWHSDSSGYMTTTNPFLNRGGSYYFGTSSGLFYPGPNHGDAYAGRTFRLALVI